MSKEIVLEYFTALGFEETDIEDGLTALFFELDEAGSYALVTDENGSFPETLPKPLVFACYSPAGAYQWSAMFKNSRKFQEFWSDPIPLAQKLSALQEQHESIPVL
jgi:hypothetical protein